MAVVTPTDRPKSVSNRCFIELIVPLFVLSLCNFIISFGTGATVLGLSQISSFLSLSDEQNRAASVELNRAYMKSRTPKPCCTDNDNCFEHFYGVLPFVDWLNNGHF